MVSSSGRGREGIRAVDRFSRAVFLVATEADGTGKCKGTSGV